MSDSAGSGLAPDVRRFLTVHIDSVEQLEVLLLLRDEPARAWTPDEVASALRTSATSAVARLDDLARRGLARAEPRSRSFRFAPADATLARQVDLVAAAYRDRRVTVIGFIYSRPLDPVRELARAFRVGGDDDDA